MSREKHFSLIFFTWLVVLTFFLVFLVTRAPAAGIKGRQLIYSDSLAVATDYMAGDFYSVENRYVSYKLGWNSTTTSTVTFTLWLADPVGTTCCTTTVTSTINIAPAIFTLGNYTVTGQYWAAVNGSIENDAGMITPTVDVYLHGQ